jgi:amino acid transporter
VRRPSFPCPFSSLPPFLPDLPLPSFYTTFTDTASLCRTPYIATAVCSAICCIAYLAVSSGSKVVFGYFVAMVTMCGAITWSVLIFTHIRFMKALKVQGISRDELPYKTPFQPYISYFGLVITLIVAFFKGFDAFTIKFNHKTFISTSPSSSFPFFRFSQVVVLTPPFSTAHYILVPVFVICYFGYKFVYKTRVIPLAEVDLVTGRREFEEDAAMWEEKAAGTKRSIWKKIWDGA